MSCYEIRVQGRLEPRWAAWFDAMSLTDGDDGTTTLAGPALDQAALHAVLRKVRDVGLVLLSVTRVDPGEQGAAPTTQPTGCPRTATAQHGASPWRP